jgi:Uma2 family endonuclease
MPVAPPVSLEESLHTIYEPDCEYLDGELVERNMAETDHGSLQALIASWFVQRRKQFGIQVASETRVQIKPTRFRIPDLLVTVGKLKGRILCEPPFLCIEILSPEDRASRVEPKIDEYLAFGVRHVWLIDPEKRRAWSFTSEGKREATDVLSTANPDIHLPISDPFFELDEMVDLSEDQ